MTDSLPTHLGPDALAELSRGRAEVDDELRLVLEHVVTSAASVENARAKEFLLQGVARRLRLLRRALNNVFVLFPPSAIAPINSDSLDDAQISLHAFVMNICGLFDNLAWAFVWHHGLERRINRRLVGMFSPAMTRYWPPAMQQYVATPKVVNWVSEYLKNYRDALAHRIPLYIPPASYSETDAARAAAIQRESAEALQAQDWIRLSTLIEEEEKLGTACPMFAHSFDASESSKTVYLHPQMLSDAKTVVEACTLFLAHWRERSSAAD